MLSDFQQAFADLVASPALCRDVLIHSERLSERYQLTRAEQARLLGIVRHPGMACVCMLYRANRLAPLAMNLPGVCRALGHDLTSVLDDYWAVYPNSNVHFVLESHRFGAFVQRRLADGGDLPDTVAPALAEEMAILSTRLAASYTDVPADTGAMQRIVAR